MSIHPPNRRLLEHQLTHSILGAFYEVHRVLGYGFLEHVYRRALEYELIERGHEVSREATVRVYYKGVELASQRMDMVIDQRVVIEVKATHDLPRVASLQLYNYLRATRLEIGLLLHFGPRAAFQRIVSSNRSLDTTEPRSSALDPRGDESGSSALDPRGDESGSSALDPRGNESGSSGLERG